MIADEKSGSSRLPPVMSKPDGPTAVAEAKKKPAQNGTAASVAPVPEVEPVAAEPAKKRGRKKGRRAKTKRATRRTRLFPPTSFDEALVLGEGIQKHASGKPIARILLLDQMKKSASADATRRMITASSQYGLTKGNFNADQLALTPEGVQATSAEVSAQARLQARFGLAIEKVAPFKALYEEYRNNKLPAQAVLEDFVVKHGVDSEDAAECVETFLVNLKSLGMLRPMAGAERILTPEHALAAGGLPSSSSATASFSAAVTEAIPTGGAAAGQATDWDKICFYMTPIGEADTEQRKHADLFLNHVIEPALKEFGLYVVRADKIGKPGLITAQVMEHVVRSKLVVVDLSFHNPSVFYELALRHTCGLPTVQIIRARDKIPFDVQDMRTVTIDNTDIYTLLPQMQTYHAEIASQVRRALQPGGDAPNPISAAVPGLKVSIPPPRGG